LLLLLLLLLLPSQQQFSGLEGDEKMVCVFVTPTLLHVLVEKEKHFYIKYMS